MNLDQLTYIVEVARVKSLASAAQNLHVTQSAISQAISSLENELGVKLFDRSRMGSFPTEEGKGMIKKMFEVSKLVQEIRIEADSRMNSLSGHLRIATMPTEMITLIRVISQLNKEHPDLRIEVLEKGSQEIIADIQSGKADLGFVALPENLFPLQDLHFHTLFKGSMMIAAGKALWPHARRTITPQEIQQHPFVVYKDDYVDRFIEDFGRKFGPINVLFRTNNGSAVQRALEEGLALTIGHDYSFYTVEHLIRDNLVMLDIDHFTQQPVHFGWVWSDKQPSSLYSYFIARFRQESEQGNTEFARH